MADELILSFISGNSVDVDMRQQSFLSINFSLWKADQDIFLSSFLHFWVFCTATRQYLFLSNAFLNALLHNLVV